MVILERLGQPVNFMVRPSKLNNMFLVLLPGHFCEVVMVANFYLQHVVI